MRNATRPWKRPGKAGWDLLSAWEARLASPPPRFPGGVRGLAGGSCGQFGATAVREGGARGVRKAREHRQPAACGVRDRAPGRQANCACGRRTGEALAWGRRPQGNFVGVRRVRSLTFADFLVGLLIFIGISHQSSFME